MKEEIVTNETTKGEIFKAKTGYSKSTKRLLKKYNISIGDVKLAIKELSMIRKEFRMHKKLIKKKKHSDALALRKKSKPEIKAKPLFFTKLFQ